MAAMYLASGQMGGDRGNPLYAILLAAPYLALAAFFLPRRSPSAPAWSFARAVSIVASIAIATIGVGVALAGPFTLIAFVLGDSVAYPVKMLYASVANVLWGAMELGRYFGNTGLCELALLFVIQFPLRRAARRGRPMLQNQDVGDRSIWALAGVTVPFVVAGFLGHVNRSVEQSNVAKSVAENSARASVDRAAARDRAFEAVQAARTGLHTCANGTCRDSLVAALKEHGLAVSYVSLPHDAFRVFIAGDADAKERYITDETGILLRWNSDGEPFANPSWNSQMDISDHTFGQLFAKFACLPESFSENWSGSYPRHLKPEDDCGLQSDTTDVALYANEQFRPEYQIIYSAGKPGTHNRVTKFSLNARPAHYGQPAVRSFLLTEDSVAHVTTQDRAARKSDPVVHVCERIGRCAFPPT